MPIKPKLRVAVIGAGNMGRHHVRNYSLMPDVELIAVSDINPKSKKIAQDHEARFYLDYRKMLEKEKPQIVSVVVPTPLHLEVGTYCMERGIHCLVEKPIAYSLSDADKLINLAKDQKVVFTVGHIERYNPLVRKIHNLIKQNKLGQILSVSCRRVGGFPAVEPKTDVIIDLAVHDIDMINFLLNRHPERITSHGSRTHHSKKIDAAEILMDYGDAAGIIQANWVTPVKIRTIAITGSKGHLEGNYITQELVYYEHNMRDVKKEGFSNFVRDLGEPRRQNIKVRFEEPLAVELKSFLGAVNGDRRAEVVDPEDAREALKLALEAVKNYE